MESITRDRQNYGRKMFFQPIIPNQISEKARNRESDKKFGLVRDCAAISFIKSDIRSICCTCRPFFLHHGVVCMVAKIIVLNFYIFGTKNYATLLVKHAFRHDFLA